jgi:RNA polymerase sigma-70 factor (ECF subfamily)
LRDRARFRAWLVRIAFRLALDRLRAAKRREQREALWFRETTRQAASVPTQGEFHARLEKALEELPEKLRLVLLLSAIEGHTIEEVAALVGVPVGTVKSRLFMARKLLAEKLRCFVRTTENRS